MKRLTLPSVTLLSVTLLSALLLFSCSNLDSTDNGIRHSSQDSLYKSIGGEQKIALIVDNFINEIGYNETIFEYFKDSDIDRFREKMIEHLYITLGGPCQYSGDSMEEVHRGMNINEGDFNLTVELLINAMIKANISHPQQNKVLARLAPMRREILYKR